MTVSYTENLDQKTVELMVSGKITQEDFDQISGQLDEFIQTCGTVKLLEVVTDFTGFEVSMLWDGMKYDIKNLKHISHCAVVTDIGWISPLSKAAGAFVSTKLRTFDAGQIDDARAWLQNPDILS